MKKHTIQISTALCIGCGLCERDCPAGNITTADKKAVLKTQDCILCGHCVAVCPQAAVSMTGFDDPPAVFDKRTTLNPQQLLDALRTRRSIRQFEKKPVPDEVIEKIIEAGRWTPTAKNAQNTSYLVLQDKKDRAEAAAVRFFKRLLPAARLFYPAARGIEIDSAFFFKGAPAAIAVVSKDKVSASLAASNMALMAEACGLGVLYSGFFTIAANNSPALRKTLGLKGGEKVVTTLVLGYPAVNYRRTAPKERAAVSRL